MGKPLEASATCPFDVTLSNGETRAFDVPFTDHQKICCCGSCQEGYVSDWNMVTIALPPSFDASPFPPFDASDAALD